MKSELSHYRDISPYQTKDGSQIRELMHPSTHACAKQSLAEAIVQPGQSTQLHYHAKTEEFYHIIAGTGLMRLGEECFQVSQGDSVAIAPGTPHNILALGEETLRFLCCCSPAYSHEDTLLLSED